MKKAVALDNVWSLVAFAGLCVVLATAGCTFTLTDFSIISTRSDNTTLKLERRVTAESCSYLLFYVIPVAGDTQATLKQAIDRALDKGNAKFLIDGIASDQITGEPPIVHEHWYIIEGGPANPNLP